MRTRIAWLAASCFVFSAADALAVTQPSTGGITIPTLNADETTCRDKNVQLCLDLAEGATGSVDAQDDALVAPETFQPTCALTFTPVVKGGEDTLAFGWYNVQADPGDSSKTLEPANTELYAMMTLPHGFQSNAQLADAVPPVTLDLVAEAEAGRYLGGEIAFFLANAEGGSLEIDPETHQLIGNPVHLYYTEHAFNPGSGSSQTFYQVLTWQSATIENAFYFGWEDRPASSGGDNDFDDVLIQVSGIQCSGGGEACETGLDGVCAEGTMLCQRGALTCLPNVPASDETCNALDDDCDGEVDEGDLCEENYVCDRGTCVPRCSAGEFRCLDTQVCTDLGLCVDKDCADKTCPDGQVCRDGDCVEACAGVVCPYGRVCRNDACVDPCANIECDEGTSCVNGICQSCECSSCEGGLICQDNACIDPECADVTCETGMHCQGGVCVDNCENAVCPAGTTCSAGECVLDGSATGAGGQGVGVTDGGIIIGTGASSSMDPESDGIGRRAVGETDGCACDLMRRPSSSVLGPLLALLALGLVRRRRS